MADPYTVLGVARTADEAAIKKAYRKLAKELHPDRNKDDPKKAARFGQVTQAYDLLSDKDKRARFDRGEIDGDGNPAAPFGYGRAPGGMGGGRPGGSPFDFGGAGPGGGGSGGGGEPGGFSDLFEELLGGRARGGFSGGFGRREPPAKGANVAYRLKVGFVDAASLSPQRITLADGKSIDLKLSAGVETGTQMRLGGKGQPGAGGAGDAIVTVEIEPHRFFTRDGDDVRLDLPVTLKEAVLGGAVKVPTVEGAVTMTVPKGASSGKVMRLKGRGFHKKAGGRGDQLVTLMVEVPADDAALEAFVADWSGAEGNPRGKMGV